jgi:hypothetical protein
MNPFKVVSWGENWAWSLPLIAVTVGIHVVGLGLITNAVDRLLRRLHGHLGFVSNFAIVVSIAAAAAALLHGIEAAIWAFAYLMLEAFPDSKLAMLFSLGAMTTFGNTDASLPSQWRMMGALEALNGMLLFGLTTAFLFAMIQGVRPVGDHGVRRHCS